MTGPPEQQSPIDRDRARLAAALPWYVNGSLDEEDRGRLRDDLIDLWSAHNRAPDGATEVDGEYLEVIGIRA